MHIDAAEKEDGVWVMGDADYAWVCVAFELFGRQLYVAPLDSIAKAEARMVGGLLNGKQRLATAEVST